MLLEEPIKRVLELRNYISGEWVESGSGEYRDVVNPATMKTLAKVPISGSDDVGAAVDAAADAFPGWRRTPPLSRARYFFRLKELMEGSFEELP